jgi:hypothetical protein
MPPLVGRDASIYWGTGTPALIGETRNIAIDLGTDWIDDTVHGDTVRSEAPSFSKFGASVTGLWDSTLGKSDEIVKNALARTSGTFSLYWGNSNRYFYGSGYVGDAAVESPYEDFAPFNWSIKAIGTVGFYAK